MSGAGRKLAVVFGLVLATTVVSGVAAAEPEREGGPQAEARAGGSQATSVAGDQYAGSGGGSGAGGEEGERPDDDRPEPGASPGKQVQAPRVDSGDEEPREDGEDSRRSATQERTGQQSLQRQSVRRDVSRESEDSGRARASADIRRVQSPEIRSRVRELQREARVGKLPPAATSYNEGRRQRELRIAREKIVAQPVDEASLRRYKELYEEAAEEYGFGEDWYVLAAVGKVESDHGQNMGPSSAGALGPMQFMPSTWASYGLDANDDGKANIMDPEDAIPSAARYLKVGGAPEDWYRALYTYNHAGWYVEKVLRVAERYRLAAGDEEAGPYYPDEDR